MKDLIRNILKEESKRTLNEQSSTKSIPFTNKTEGNAFRAWVNDNHPTYAKEINLSRTGSHNNSHIQKAWNKYGDSYIANKDFTRCHKFSGKHIPRDIFIKTFKLGYFIRVDGTSVDGMIELSDGIYEKDPGSPPGETIGMNATTFINYAKIANITDNGDPITIDNVWVECKLNQNIVISMENETLTMTEKLT